MKKLISTIIASFMVLFLFAPIALAGSVIEEWYNAETGKWELTVQNNPDNRDDEVSDEIGYYDKEGKYQSVTYDKNQETCVVEIDGLKETPITILIGADQYADGEPVPSFTVDYRTNVKPGTESSLPTDPNDPIRALAEEDKNEHPRGNNAVPIIPGGQYSLIMTWYVFFGSLGAAFVFMTLIKDSYTIMFSAVNPGIRASYTETIQRILIGVLLVALIPVILSLLIDVNDALVKAIASQLQLVQDAKESNQTPFSEGTDVIASLVSSIPLLLVNVVEWMFSMQNIDALIFNGPLYDGAYDTLVFNVWALQTGNAFADALIQCGMLFFEIYFNIFYIIRQWTFSLMFILAPLAVWIWVVSGRNEVITTWAATTVMKIFIQTVHALCFAVFFGFLMAGSAVTSDTGNTMAAVQSIVNIGVLLAGFGGIICAGALVFLGIKMMFASNETVVAGIKQGMIKTLIALGIMTTAWTIAPLLTTDNIPVVEKPIASQAEEAEGDITVLGTFIALACIIGASKTVSSLMGEAIQGISGDSDNDRVMGSIGQSIKTAVHYSQVNKTNKLLEQRNATSSAANVAGKTANPSPPPPTSPSGGGTNTGYTVGAPIGASINKNQTTVGQPQGATQSNSPPSSTGANLPGSSPSNVVTVQDMHKDNLKKANAAFKDKEPPKTPMREDAEKVNRRVAPVAGAVAKAAKFATPPVAPGANTVNEKLFGGSSMATGSIVGTGALAFKSITQGARSGRFSIDDLNRNVREYTGENNTTSAWTRLGVGVVASPLGPEKSMGLADKAIAARNFTINKWQGRNQLTGDGRNSIDNWSRRI